MRFAARLLCAAATCVLATAAAAQTSDDLDPAAPLEPLPGLEVDWPDLNAADLVRSRIAGGSAAV